MTKRVVATSDAPSAIGPYSQAIVANGFVFASGQIGLDPKTGAMVTGGLEAETKQVLANLRAVLEAAGASFDGVVRTTIFLTTMDHFAQVNALYGEVFQSAPPARATVAVAGLPKGALVEIDAVAVVSRGETS